MRRLPFAVLSLSMLACGGDDGSSTPDDAAVIDTADPDDARDAPFDAPGPDAPQAACLPQNGTTITLAPVASGISQAVGLASPPGDASRLYVLGQPGVIRIIENGTLLETPFVDLRDNNGGPVLDGGERGLLGIAFHPQYATNRKLYLYFTRAPDGDNTVAEYIVDPGGLTLDASSRRDVLVIDDPASNHNAGWIQFGSDGLLYIPTGDGGGGGDPNENAQDDRELLGKVLRIDVDSRTGAKQYGIPPGNPHAASADGPNDPRPEIWHKGLRNPFRFGFDRANGDIYLGDVGQGVWEEIDYSPNVAGINWGWDDREGAHCYEPMNGCLTAGRTDPITEHAQADGWRSIIGGTVYRGTCFPDLVGDYFYGDYYAGELWSLRVSGGQATERRRRVPGVGSITGIMPDAAGELYVVTHDGRVRRIVAGP